MGYEVSLAKIKNKLDKICKFTVKKGLNNDVDYYTKHHSSKRRRTECKKLVLNCIKINTLQKVILLTQRKWRGFIEPLVTKYSQMILSGLNYYTFHIIPQSQPGIHNISI